MGMISSYRFYDLNTIHNFIAYWSPIISPIVLLLGKRKTILLYLKGIYAISWLSYHVSYPIAFALMFKFFSIMKLSNIAKFFENKALNSPFILLIKSMKERPLLTKLAFMKLNQLNAAGIF